MQQKAWLQVRFRNQAHLLPQEAQHQALAQKPSSSQVNLQHITSENII
jgi:hypothetical protein